MTVLWHSDRRLWEEGRGAAQKQQGGGEWRLNGTMQAGAARTGHVVQPQTDINEKTM